MAEHNMVDWDIDNNIPASDPRSPMNPAEAIAKFQVDSEPFFKKMAEAFAKLVKAINELFPFGVAMYQAHREEARRVHTAYRNKRKGRW